MEPTHEHAQPARLGHQGGEEISLGPTSVPAMDARALAGISAVHASGGPEGASPEECREQSRVRIALDYAKEQLSRGLKLRRKLDEALEGLGKWRPNDTSKWRWTLFGGCVLGALASSGLSILNSTQLVVTQLDSWSAASFAAGVLGFLPFGIKSLAEKSRVFERVIDLGMLVTFLSGAAAYVSSLSGFAKQPGLNMADLLVAPANRQILCLGQTAVELVVSYAFFGWAKRHQERLSGAEPLVDPMWRVHHADLEALEGKMETCQAKITDAEATLEELRVRGSAAHQDKEAYRALMARLVQEVESARAGLAERINPKKA